MQQVEAQEKSIIAVLGQALAAAVAADMALAAAVAAGTDIVRRPMLEQVSPEGSVHPVSSL